MTIASEITKLNTNLTNSYTACQSKGATMPANQNFDNLATCIDSIQTGGGGVSIETVTLTVQIYYNDSSWYNVSGTTPYPPTTFNIYSNNISIGDGYTFKYNRTVSSSEFTYHSGTWFGGYHIVSIVVPKSVNLSWHIDRDGWYAEFTPYNGTLNLSEDYTLLISSTQTYDDII